MSLLPKFLPEFLHYPPFGNLRLSSSSSSSSSPSSKTSSSSKASKTRKKSSIRVTKSSLSLFVSIRTITILLSLRQRGCESFTPQNVQQRYVRHPRPPTTITTTTTTTTRHVSASTSSPGNSNNYNNNNNYSKKNKKNSQTETTTTTQQIYLQRHQRVNQRRAWRRFFDISRVLTGRVVRPLVCSLVKDPKVLMKQFDDNQAWDEFWLHQSGSGPKYHYRNNKIKNKNKLLQTKKKNKSTSTSTSTAVPTSSSSQKEEEEHESTTTTTSDTDTGGWSNAQRVAMGLTSLGPTYVKLGQALATRPDILHVPLADALNHLQDSMAPFDNRTAKRIIRRDLQMAIIRENHLNKYLKTTHDVNVFMDTLSNEPIAAASIAQVYKGYLPGFGSVAVKVQRPGIRQKVERDATMFHSAAAWIGDRTWARNAESQFLTGPFLSRLNIVQAVDEFTSRVLEDMDFVGEVANMQVFSTLYDRRRGPTSRKSIQNIIVPKVIPELCSNRIIVMEWLEGTKLTHICEDCNEDDANRERQENLLMIEKAIECTLCQLMDSGIIHGEPHVGNLLKVRNSETGDVELGYLDFGLVNAVPQRFRDGIVCAVVQVVFARNIKALADLCVDIGLLDESTMADPIEKQKLLDALSRALDTVLLWPKDQRGRSTALPQVRFQNLLASLAILMATFDFTVPPYFLNNARALATLEGIALKLDPNFNILRVVYPYSINHLMRNSKVSTKAQDTFLEICRDPTTKLVDLNQFMVLLNDWALLTGHKKRRIFWDLLTSRGGRHVSARIVQEFFLKRWRRLQRVILHRLSVDGTRQRRNVWSSLRL